MYETQNTTVEGFWVWKEDILAREDQPTRKYITAKLIVSVTWNLMRTQLAIDTGGVCYCPKGG
jgi:hypothetical protein